MKHTVKVQSNQLTLPCKARTPRTSYNMCDVRLHTCGTCVHCYTCTRVHTCAPHVHTREYTKIGRTRALHHTHQTKHDKRVGMMVRLSLTPHLVALLLAAHGGVPASAAAACPPADADATELTVADVQGLLEAWDLSFAFGDEFVRQRVNGFQLMHIEPETVDPAAYPNAQPFHWSSLWSRLKICGISGGAAGAVTAAASATAAETASLHTPLSRRNLATGAAGMGSKSGVRILSNESTIVLGATGDIELRRESESVLGVHNHLSFCNGNGIQFCNDGGDNPGITSDGEGNVYVTGNFHFLGNVTFAGVHIDQYIAKVFDTIEPEKACSDGSCASCAEIKSEYPTATDGVYFVDPDGSDSGTDPFYVYCDMTGGGWTLLMRYGETGYMSEFNFDEAQVPTTSGGQAAPTDEVWCPLPSGDNDGHVAMTSFDMTGGRLLKASCDKSGDSYSYTTDLVEDWVAGPFGTDQGTGTSSAPVAWGILSGNDIGVDGRSHHYICGSVEYDGSRGVGFCSGRGSTSSWSPHLASISFWPGSIAVGCAAGDGDSFELWVK